ncbi:MAG: hypothetical protein AB1725_04635 [Armatimonadota bacterium]
MMCAILALASVQGPTVAISGTGESLAVSLRYDGTTEVVRYLPPRPATAKAFRFEDRWAVWDRRGLSVRVGERVRTFALTDYALHPKLWSREEIVKTKSLIDKGERKREPSACAGAVQIGAQTFWLFQWSDTSGAVWMEVPLRVDLAEDDPRPKLYGDQPWRLALRTSRTAGPFVGSALDAIGPTLVAPGTFSDGTWGFAVITEGSVEYKRVETEGVRSSLLHGGRVYYVTSGTPTRIRLVDVITGERLDVAEAPTHMVQLLAAGGNAWASWVTEGGGITTLSVVHLANRSQKDIPARARGPVIRAGRFGVVVFDGSGTNGAPTRVLVLDPETLVVTHDIDLR